MSPSINSIESSLGIFHVYAEDKLSKIIIFLGLNCASFLVKLLPTQPAPPVTMIVFP